MERRHAELHRRHRRPVTGSQDYLARISIPLKNGLNGIIDEMDQKGATLKVAIVDACRDNPFIPLAGKRSIGLTRGMVRIEPPGGTFVVLSAGAGQSALDRLSDGDPDPNGVFTRVFVPAIRADMTLQEAIKTTQEQVVALAKSVKEDQNPAYYDEVIGSACLSAKCHSGAAAPPVASVPAISPPSADEGPWQRIAASIDPVDFESFARVFPDSAHKAEADARAKTLRKQIESKKEPKVAALDLGQAASGTQRGKGWSGLTLWSITAEIARSLKLGHQKGALVAAPEQNGSAAAAGVRPGDVIVAINGRPIDNPADLNMKTAGFAPDTDVKVTYWRNGILHDVDIKLGKLPTSDQ